LLLFLRDAAPLLPPRDCSAVCTSMLKLTSLGSPPLTAAVMQVHTYICTTIHHCVALFLHVISITFRNACEVCVQAQFLTFLGSLMAARCVHERQPIMCICVSTSASGCSYATWFVCQTALLVCVQNDSVHTCSLQINTYVICSIIAPHSCNKLMHLLTLLHVLKSCSVVMFVNINNKQCLSAVIQSPHRSCLPPAALPPLIIALLDVQPNGTNGAGAAAFAQVS
jgi:hypothetical protein